MKFNLKNVFLSVGMLVFVFAMFGFSANKAQAATCTVATGTWDGTANADNAGLTHGTAVWSGCTGGAGFTPAVGDTVEIPDGVILTVTGNATVAAVLIDTTATGANGIIVATTKTLTVSGTVVYTANSGAFDQSITLAGTGTLTASGTVTLNAPSNASGTATLAIGAGTLGAPNLNIVGGVGISEVTLGVSGHLTIAANVTLSGTAANARLTTAGAGAKTIAITGNLVDGGTVTFGGSTLTSTVTGTTGISSGGSLTLSDATGTYTFSGIFTVSAGGTYLETVPGTHMTFTLAVNNAGTFTTSTGTHTFSAAINNTGIFNYAEGVTLTTLADSTSGTINYTGGAQTVQLIKYYNLGLSGSGVKVVGALIGATQILNNFSISGGAQASLTGDSTANAYYLNGSQKFKGSWGSGSSVASHRDSVNFAGTNLITIATGPSGTSTITTTNSSPSTSTTTTAPSSPVTNPVPAPTPVVCPPGQLFSATTGERCTATTAVVSCPAGQLFSATTGERCTSTTAMVYCPSGQMYSAMNGEKCTSWTGGGSSSYAFGSATVKSGSVGEACRAWQQFFNDKAGAHLSLDGRCGPLTMAVAKAWQSAHGLVADGLLGPASRAKANAQ